MQNLIVGYAIDPTGRHVWPLETAIQLRMAERYNHVIAEPDTTLEEIKAEMERLQSASIAAAEQ